MNVTTQIELKLRNSKSIIPIGSEISVFTHSTKKFAIIFWNGQKIASSFKFLFKISTEFIEITDEVLSDAAFGECVSVTGETVDPDGYDDNGFPSVLLAMGMI